MMSSAKIKRLEISTPQGEAGLLEKESRFVFNYTHPGKDREISLIMPGVPPQVGLSALLTSAASQSRTTASTASANASGASCGRLCPMPPVMSRCWYLPVNCLA